MKEYQNMSFAPAPLGARLRFIMLITAVAVVFADLLIVLLMNKEKTKEFIAVICALFIGHLIIASVWFFSRIHNYEFVGQELKVTMTARSARYPLAGLVSAEAAPHLFKGSRKRGGNDGLGALAGTYHSKRYGDFHVLMTDSSKAVLLKLADGRAIAVSPDLVKPFIEAAKKRAG